MKKSNIALLIALLAGISLGVFSELFASAWTYYIAIIGFVISFIVVDELINKEKKDDSKAKGRKKSVSEIYTVEGTFVADMSATLKNAEQLSDLADIVKKIQEEMSDLNSEQELMSKQLEELTDDTNDELVDKFISDVKLKLAKNDERIDDLQKQVNNLTSKVLSLEGLVSTLCSRVSKLEVEQRSSNSTYYTTTTTPML